MKLKNFNGRHEMLSKIYVYKFNSETQDLDVVGIEEINLPVYTVGCTQSMTDDTIGKTTHYANDDQETLCGKKITERWYILTNRNDGIATCKKCIKEVVK